MVGSEHQVLLPPEQAASALDGCGSAQPRSRVTFAHGPLRRIVRGIGALSLGALVTLFGQLVIVPVAIRGWGENRYGEWVLLTGLVSILRLTDLGLQTFVVNRMTEASARDEPEELQRILSSALRVQWPLSGAFLLVLGALTFVLPLDTLFGLKTINGPHLGLVGTLLALELLLGSPLGVIGGVYRAIGRLPRAAMLGSVQQLALVCLTIALMAVRADFLVIAAARVVVTLVAATWMIRDLKRVLPRLTLAPWVGEWRSGLSMIGPGLFFLLIPLADYLSTQVALTLVQRSLDGSEVSRLATHRTTANLAQLASTIFMTAAWPELTALRAAGRNADLRRLHESLAKANLWLVGGLGFGILPFVMLVYPSWTAGRLVFDPVLFIMLMVRLLLWSVWSTSMTVLLATNRHRRVAASLLVAGALSAIVSLLVVPRFGIRGAALAPLLGDFAVSAWFIPRLLMLDIGGSVREFARSMLGAAALGLVLPLGVALLAWNSIPSPLVQYGLILPTSVALAAVLIWSRLAPAERQVAARLYGRLGARRKLRFLS